MMDYKVKIGLVPLRRDTTNRPAKTFLTWVSAEERGHRFVDYIEKNFSNENVEFVDTKGLGSNDLIYNEESVAQTVARFKEADVDAVLIINTNFGNEESAADLVKALGKPACIWAPLDDEYYVHGMRPTDSQCGSFGVTRQMQRYHIPFSHINCCRVESDTFAKGLDSFIRVACMVKNFTGMRIGQIGARPKPFFSVIWNEGELMEKFGIRIIPINFAFVQQAYNAVEEENPAEVDEAVNYFLNNFEYDDLTEAQVKKMAILAVTYERLFKEYNVDVMSSECWTGFPQMFDGLCPCAVFGYLNDKGYYITCESDVHCALTASLLASAAMGKARPFLGEFTVRHPENENAELLWHCGPFPLSVKAPDCKAELVNQREWFRAKDGTYTVARIDQEHGNYFILPLVCKTVPGPETHGTYLWGEFDNLDKVESRLLDGPYIHHFVEIEGDYTRELKEFCKYFPNLNADTTLEK